MKNIRLFWQIYPAIVFTTIISLAAVVWFISESGHSFYLDQLEEAWKRLLCFEEESKAEDFDKFRLIWESRMQYLASQILLKQNKIDEAETIIERNLERAKREHMKKNEGRFLRLLGEIQARRNEAANAIATLNEATHILEEVGNRRQMWQAHASLASTLAKFGRSAEAREKWSSAADLIHATADGLADSELRERFLGAKPIRGILAKA